MNEDAEGKQEQNEFEDLIQGILKQDYGCCDDFMDSTVVSGLRAEIQSLSESGNMQLAGFGNKMEYQKDNRVRGDTIKWIEKESENKYEAIYLKKIGKFIQYLNETCYTSINGFESHYASYQQHSFYKRHLDQFEHDKKRKYSMVLYLNENWQKEDGGMLSLYPEAAKQKDISPLGGRMVFFKSDEMEHEVKPSATRDRLSIAGWFKS